MEQALQNKLVKLQIVGLQIVKIKIVELKKLKLAYANLRENRAFQLLHVSRALSTNMYHNLQKTLGINKKQRWQHNWHTPGHGRKR